MAVNGFGSAPTADQMQLAMGAPGAQSPATVGMVSPRGAGRVRSTDQLTTAGAPVMARAQPLNLAAASATPARAADWLGLGATPASGAALLHTTAPHLATASAAASTAAAAPTTPVSTPTVNPNAGLPPVGTAVSHDGTNANTNIYRNGNTFTDVAQPGQKPMDFSGSKGGLTVVPAAAFANGIGTGYDPSRPVPTAGGMSGGGGPVFSDPLHGEVDQWQPEGGNNAGMIRDLESRVAAGTGSNASFGDIISAKLAGRQLQNMYAARDNNYRTNAMMFDSQAGRDATLAADNNRNIFGMWKVNQDAANTTALHKMDNEARTENAKMLVGGREAALTAPKIVTVKNTDPTTQTVTQKTMVNVGGQLYDPDTYAKLTQAMSQAAGTQ